MMTEAQNQAEVAAARSPEMAKMHTCIEAVTKAMPDASRSEKLEALKTCLGTDDLVELDDLFLE